jgi:choice-of-anchor B domain-containing protein
MRFFFLFLFSLLLFPFKTTAQINISQESVTYFPGQTLANVWGYTAPNGKEYALVGGSKWMSVYNITDLQPGNLPTLVDTVLGPNNLWKEIKTYITPTSAHAYIVSEGGWGVQVVDLSNIASGNLLGASVYPTTPFGTITKAHALQVDEAKGFLYLFGTNVQGGRPICLSLANPAVPTYVGYYSGVGYAHDGYANNDTLYSAHINAGKFAIVDMTNKIAPVDITSATTTPNAFTHNTWRYGNTVFTTDERLNSYLTAYDITGVNLTGDVPEELDRIQIASGSTTAIHNTYIKNGYAVTSWYMAGVVIVDVSRPANMVITGHLDTYNLGSPDGFDGCWGVYPYFNSGKIIASNIQEGTAGGALYILNPTYLRGCYVEGDVKTLVGSIMANVNGALVELRQGTTVVTSLTTNVTGLFKLAVNNPGSYTLRVSKAGYNTVNVPLTLARGVLNTQNIVLTTSSLPVELTDFKVSLRADDSAVLDWATAAEVNNRGFEVEQSADGATWRNIGFVAAKGTASTYRFNTATLSPGMWYFRLVQVDIDGATNVLPMQQVEVSAAVTHVKIWPNPTADWTEVTVTPTSNGAVTIQLIDGTGAVLQQVEQAEALAKQPNLFRLNTENVPAGYYLVRVLEGGQQRSYPLVKQ